MAQASAVRLAVHSEFEPQRPPRGTWCSGHREQQGIEVAKTVHHSGDTVTDDAFTDGVCQVATYLQQGHLPSPWVHFDYSSWSEQAWSLLMQQSEELYTWHCCMYGEQSGWGSEEWTVFREAHPHEAQLLDTFQGAWQMQTPTRPLPDPGDPLVGGGIATAEWLEGMLAQLGLPPVSPTSPGHASAKLANVLDFNNNFACTQDSAVATACRDCVPVSWDAEAFDAASEDQDEATASASPSHPGLGASNTDALPQTGYQAPAGVVRSSTLPEHAGVAELRAMLLEERAKVLMLEVCFIPLRHSCVAKNDSCIAHHPPRPARHRLVGMQGQVAAARNETAEAAAHAAAVRHQHAHLQDQHHQLRRAMATLMVRHCPSFPCVWCGCTHCSTMACLLNAWRQACYVRDAKRHACGTASH